MPPRKRITIQADQQPQNAGWLKVPKRAYPPMLGPKRPAAKDGKPDGE
jgi:hypothetical protein